MYTHLGKGFTTGHLLGRRLLRGITCIPGIVLDVLLFAPWATPNYMSYWNDQNKLEYADGIKAGGAQVVFGYIGDLAGAVLGAIIGCIIGGVLYFPDLILRGLSGLYHLVADAATAFATDVGGREFFRSLQPFQNPDNFVKRAWNISVATLGIAIAVIPYLAARIIETVFPITNGLSDFIWSAIGMIVGAVGTLTASLIIYPVNHICNILTETYDALRNDIRSIVAFIYAKTETAPAQHYVAAREIPESLENEALHSDEFRGKVTEYTRLSTAEILFGGFNYHPVDNENHPPHDEAENAHANGQEPGCNPAEPPSYSSIINIDVLQQAASAPSLN